MGLNDLFATTRTTRLGTRGTTSALSDRRGSVSEAIRELARAEGISPHHDFASARDFEVWAERVADGTVPLEYYDYFFSGSDVQVTIEGIEEDRGKIPFVNFGYGIQQQKIPVYGLWSYTYDGVLRGTRVVSGSFSVATRGTNYFKNLISEATTSRSRDAGTIAGQFKDLKSGFGPSRALTEDDKNIDKYWSRNIDPYLGNDGRNIFSVHPPFNFVITLGVQLTSANTTMGLGQYDLTDNYEFDNLYTSDTISKDINERLTYTPQVARKIRIEGVELVGLETGYSPDGTPLVDTYEFFARDTSTI